MRNNDSTPSPMSEMRNFPVAVREIRRDRSLPEGKVKEYGIYAGRLPSGNRSPRPISHPVFASREESLLERNK